MKEAWDNARSIESYDGDRSDLEEIGGQESALNPDKYYILYRDKQGNYWYRTEYWTDSGPLTEFEYIFGHKPRKRTS